MRGLASAIVAVALVSMQSAATSAPPPPADERQRRFIKEIPAAYNSGDIQRYAALLDEKVIVVANQRLWATTKDQWLNHVRDSFRRRSSVKVISGAISPGNILFWESYDGGCEPRQVGVPLPACEPHFATRGALYEIKNDRIVSITFVESGSETFEVKAD